MAVKLNSTGGGSVTLDSPSTASNYTITLPSAAGTLATTTGTGSVFTNPTINGFTGDTSAITVGTTQFVKDTSGNIGIGTASPTANLHVQNGTSGNTSATIGNGAVGATASLYINGGNTSAFGPVIFGQGASSNEWFISSLRSVIGSTAGGMADYVYGAYPRVFYTNSIERLRIDASGNLGLGVTPSTWTAGVGFQVGTALSMFSNTYSYSYIMSNAYFNGTFKFKTTGYQATMYQQNNGMHAWYNSNNTNGTADATWTANQAMTLDASGRLFVGTSSNVSGNATLTLKGATSQSSLVLGNSAGTRQCDFNENGNLYLDIVKNNTTASAANVYIDPTFAVMYRSTSALKYKQDVRDLESVDIKKFRPVRYKSKCENDDQNKEHFGIIADEVLEAGFPELVILGADGEPEGFQYERLTVVLLKAIQELSAQNQALEARLAQLEAK